MMDTEKQQLLLAYLGFYQLRRHDGTLAIDGLPGPSTKEAIRSFQVAHRRRPNGTELWVDGIWGPATEAAVRQVIGTDEPPMDLEEAAHPDQIPADIWTALSACGLPPEAVAGIMGNLDAESGLRSDNMEDRYEHAKGFTDQTYTQAVDSGTYPLFADDYVGYGLAQWTWPSRKQGLLRYARDSNRSIGSATMQTEYLIKELRNQFPELLSRIMTCRDVRTATVDFMQHYEQPRDQSQEIQDDRTARAQVYYDRYALAPDQAEEYPWLVDWQQRIRCQCGGKYCSGLPSQGFSDETLELANEVGRRAGCRLICTSGYRCPHHNSETPGASPTSCHMSAIAFDCAAEDEAVSPQRLFDIADEVVGDRGGVGVYPWGIHIDSRGYRQRWDSR